MTMTFSPAGIARRRTTVERWCICHQCVFGYAIPIEVIVDEGGKKETRVCGEVCIVGMSVFDNENDDDGTTVTIADAAPTEATDSFPAPLSPVLRCNICRMVVVELSSSASSTKLSDVSDDDGTISEHN
jgi:hypothetical protein